LATDGAATAIAQMAAITQANFFIVFSSISDD
jgi:hypothetical protein